MGSGNCYEELQGEGGSMVNLLTANATKNNRDKIKVMLDAQILNSLDVGWLPENILLVTNFDYEYMGVKARKTEFNPQCLTGSKMYAVRYALEYYDFLWSHDLDAWQNVWFDSPEIKDVGATTYDNRKFNGGSIFWKVSALDIVNEIIDTIETEGAIREENVLNRVFKKHSDRVTKLNFTYNVGCSNYRGRWEESFKPVKVVHFHPDNRLAWETHALDRCKLGVKGISDRLEGILRRNYKLATELKKK